MFDFLFFVLGLLSIASTWRFVVGFLLFSFFAFLVSRFQIFGLYSNLFVILLLCAGFLFGLVWQIRHEHRKKINKTGVYHTKEEN